MIQIKQTGSAQNAGFQSMGDDFMRQISAKTAAELCGMYPTPKPGFECVVAITNNKKWPSFKNRLFVQNICGLFFVCSPNCSVAEWPEVFKVSIK